MEPLSNNLPDSLFLPIPYSQIQYNAQIVKLLLWDKLAIE